MRSRTQNGFTLLELLVAITVFATMSVMAYGGLNNVLRNSTASEEALERLNEVQKAMSFISRDFTQIIDRPVTDSYGDPLPAISTETDQDLLIEFSRNGRQNPARLMRSSQVRVAYRLQDENLYRLNWPFMDRAPGTDPYERKLLTAVESVSFRILDQDSKWQDDWPPLNADPDEIDTNMIKAIEISIRLKDWGEIKRVFEVIVG